MGFEIRFTDPALIDFQEIIDYSEEHFPGGADRMAADLFHHIELLAKYPRMGVKLKRRPQVRKIYHSPFTIYYAVYEVAQRVEVLHIWHGSRIGPYA